MLNFTNKTIRESFSDSENTYTGSVEYVNDKIASVNAWNIQVGTSTGSASMDNLGNLSISGFKTSDIITAATTIAEIFTAIEEHVSEE